MRIVLEGMSRVTNEVGGTAYGATDEFGFKAAEGKMHVHDIHATILHLLGIDHKKLTYRFQGRDFRLTDVHGNVIVCANPKAPVRVMLAGHMDQIGLMVKYINDDGFNDMVMLDSGISLTNPNVLFLLY